MLSGELTTDNYTYIVEAGNVKIDITADIIDLLAKQRAAADLRVVQIVADYEEVANKYRQIEQIVGTRGPVG